MQRQSVVRKQQVVLRLCGVSRRRLYSKQGRTRRSEQLPPACASGGRRSAREETGRGPQQNLRAEQAIADAQRPRFRTSEIARLTPTVFRTTGKAHGIAWGYAIGEHMRSTFHPCQRSSQEQQPGAAHVQERKRRPKTAVSYSESLARPSQQKVTIRPGVLRMDPGSQCLSRHSKSGAPLGKRFAPKSKINGAAERLHRTPKEHAIYGRCFGTSRRCRLLRSSAFRAKGKRAVHHCVAAVLRRSLL